MIRTWWKRFCDAIAFRYERLESGDELCVIKSLLTQDFRVLVATASHSLLPDRAAIVGCPLGSVDRPAFSACASSQANRAAGRDGTPAMPRGQLMQRRLRKNHAPLHDANALEHFRMRSIQPAPPTDHAQWSHHPKGTLAVGARAGVRVDAAQTCYRNALVVRSIGKIPTHLCRK